MTTKGITKSINVIELPTQLIRVVGNFVYLNYDVKEREEIRLPPELSPDDPQDDPRLDLPLRMNENGAKIPDRYNIIKLEKGTASVVSHEILNAVLAADDHDWVQGPNVFFTQDFIEGYVRVSPDSVISTQTFTKKVIDTTTTSEKSFKQKTLLDYLKSEASGSEYIHVNLDEFEQALKGSAEEEAQALFMIDPNTNLPISDTDVSPSSSNADSYINSMYVEKIFKRSKNSPAIWGITDRQIELAELISNQAQEAGRTRYLSSMFKTLEVFGDNQIEYTPDVINNAGELSYSHIGWHILKYMRVGNDWNYVASFVVPTFPDNLEVHESYPGSGDMEGDQGSNFYTFKDPYVLYGKSYRYEIRDAWVVETPSNPVHKLSLLLGSETVNLEIDCTEKLPPMTPGNFSFEYVGDKNIRISWLKEKKLTVPTHDFSSGLNLEEYWKKEFECNDTGGYLLFIRNSLEQGYRLEKQFHITKKTRKYYEEVNSDGSTTKVLEKEEYRETMDLTNKVLSSIIGISVPNDKILHIVDKNLLDYDLEIRSNLDYYITLCTYDVHGNISNYSEQFYVRRNNVTGEVATSLISSRGASLAYPNALIPTKFVLSSFKTSGYRYLDIYQTPDTEQSYPTEGEITIQMIDLDTEESVVIAGSSSQ